MSETTWENDIDICGQEFDIYKTQIESDLTTIHVKTPSQFHMPQGIPTDGMFVGYFQENLDTIYQQHQSVNNDIYCKAYVKIREDAKEAIESQIFGEPRDPDEVFKMVEKTQDIWVNDIPRLRHAIQQKQDEIASLKFHPEKP